MRRFREKNQRIAGGNREILWSGTRGGALLMGYQLRQHLAETLDPKVNGTKRMIVFEVACRAPNDTRTWYGTLEQLARWVGVPTADAVLLEIKRLAKLGVELRVEAGKRTDGRPTYERRIRRGEGTVWTLRIPDQLAPGPSTGQIDPSSGGKTGQIDPSSDPLGAKTGQIDRSTGQIDPSKRNPVLFSLSKGLEGSLSLVEALVRHAAVVDQGREREMIEWKNRKDNIKTDGFWHHAHKTGQLPAIAAEWAADAPRATQAAQPATPGLRSHCGACGQPELGEKNPAIANPTLRTHNGLPTGVPCPTCHRDATAKETTA